MEEIKKHLTDTICSVRKGSMDNNQFRATVEHNLDLMKEYAVSKERERIVALIISTQTKYYGLDKKTKEETYSGAGTCRQCEKRRDSLEIGQVINLINTK